MEDGLERLQLKSYKSRYSWTVQDITVEYILENLKSNKLNKTIHQLTSDGEKIKKIVHGKVKKINTKIQIIEGKQDILNTSNTFKKYLKIYTAENDTFSLVKMFIELNFKRKSDFERSKIENNLNNFITFFIDEEQTTIPTLNDIDYSTLLQIISFMKHFKGKVFHFTEVKFYELFLKCTNNLDKNTDAVKRFVNRNKLNLSSTDLKLLEKTVPKEFRPSKYII